MKNVAEVMTPNPISIAPEAPIRKALELMRQGAFRRLPVVEDGQLVGIFCDRDLRQAMSTPVVVHEKHYDDYILDHVQIGNAMTTEVLTITPQDSLAKAAKLMHDRKVGGLPVIENGSLVGILTESDLLDYLTECLEAGTLL